jgi:hypothetical protein
MGMWGFEPWKDDLAADWFAALFAKGKIAQQVERALAKTDVEEYWPEIRAAAHLVAVLGDVWPQEQFVAHHRLAIEKLTAVKQSPEFAGDDVMAGEIDAQIAVLQARLDAHAAPADVKAAKFQAKYDPAPALKQLQSANRAQQLAGLKWFTKQACQRCADWIGEPRMVEAHVPLLDSDDPQVAEEAINNIRLLMPEPPVVSPFAGAVRLMHSDRPKTRSAAVMVAVAAGGERVLEEALRLFGDKDKSVRAIAINEVANACRDWSAAAKEKLRAASEKSLNDRADEVRCAAAGLLAVVAGKAALPAIIEAKKKSSHAGWKREFQEIIVRLQK